MFEWSNEVPCGFMNLNKELSGTELFPKISLNVVFNRSLMSANKPQNVFSQVSNPENLSSQEILKDYAEPFVDTMLETAVSKPHAINEILSYGVYSTNSSRSS